MRWEGDQDFVDRLGRYPDVEGGSPVVKRRTLVLSLLIALGVVAAAWAVGVPSPSSGETGQPEHLAKMVLYACLALIFSFLCSVAEAVLLSVSPSYIVHLEQQGSTSASRLKKVKTDIDRSLAAILTLNTIAHTVGAGGAGAEAAAYFGDRYVGIAMAVLTLLILFLSEIVPKTLGAVFWRSLAGPTAWFIQILTWVLYPFIWVSERLTKLITGGKQVHIFSREEFAAMAEIGAEGGYLAAAESRILRNLFRFPELRAEDIMTPRTVVFALQQDLTTSEALEKHPEIPFSRIPVYGETRDDITGFVLKTDLLIAQLQGRGEVHLKEMKRDLGIVTEDASVEHIADELLGKRAHLLAVLDEHGGLAGVVSLEDVVETLIGIEIVDEADKIDDMRRLARQKWEERMQRLGLDPLTFKDPDDSGS
jgi:CBS domain containing-hemolysin-like protein